MDRHFLSLKLVGNATLQEATSRELVIKESSDWLESLDLFADQFNISPSQIKAIDKTYLCTAPWHKYVRHMGPKGPIKSRKIASDRGTGTFFFEYYSLLKFLDYFLNLSSLVNYCKLMKFGQVYPEMEE